MYSLCSKKLMHFFCTSATFSFPAAGLFSRSRLRSTQGARVYTTRKFGPRPGSVARAVGVQSRRELALFRGINFRRARASQAPGNPPNAFVLCSAAVY